jgi:hypothetical protein
MSSVMTRGVDPLAIVADEIERAKSQGVKVIGLVPLGGRFWSACLPADVEKWLSRMPLRKHAQPA